MPSLRIFHKKPPGILREIAEAAGGCGGEKGEGGQAKAPATLCESIAGPDSGAPPIRKIADCEPVKGS